MYFYSFYSTWSVNQWDLWERHRGKPVRAPTSFNAVDVWLNFNPDNVSMCLYLFILMLDRGSKLCHCKISGDRIH